MRELMIILILLKTLCCCAQKHDIKANYPLQVGDIYFNHETDDPNFKLCDENEVYQYYNFGKGLQYKGEKIRIYEHFKSGLTARHSEESGFLTIRFIVNCQGKTGRFRIQGMDNNYVETTFSEKLTNQLLSLTKQLDGWAIRDFDGKAFDYYQYLTFKIEKGKLIEIMP
jgi:hypothetical protein